MKRIVFLSVILSLVLAGSAFALDPTQPTQLDTEQNTTPALGNQIGNISTWTIKGAFDYNMDGCSDLVVQNSVAGGGGFGLWYFGGSNCTTLTNATFCFFNNPANTSELVPTQALGGYQIDQITDVDSTPTAWNNNGTSMEGDSSSWYNVPEFLFLNKNANNGRAAVWYLGGLNGSKIVKSSIYTWGFTP